MVARRAATQKCPLAPYAEVAPHIVLMAFLHHVANGGGSLERDYAIGTGHMDLCLRYGDVTLWGLSLRFGAMTSLAPLARASNLDPYLAELGLQQGWLVIFDVGLHRLLSGKVTGQSSPSAALTDNVENRVENLLIADAAGRP